MSNITANKYNNIRDGQFGKAPAYQALEFFIGGAVCVDSAGYVRKAADTAGFKTAGIVSGGTGPAGSTDNSNGASGDIDIAFRKGCDVWLESTGFTPAITDFNTKVYWSDDQTVAKVGTTTNDILAGRIVDFDGTKVLVRLATPGEMDDLAGIAALTDNSGGAAADGTIGAVTAPTALTNNSGSAASDGTIGVITLPTTLTDSSAGTADGTLEALPNPTDSPATADALRDDLVAVHWPVLRNWAADIAARQAENKTAITALRDFIGEFATAQTANRTAIIALKDAVAELATKVNEIINA